MRFVIQSSQRTNPSVVSRSLLGLLIPVPRRKPPAFRSSAVASSSRDACRAASAASAAQSRAGRVIASRLLNKQTTVCYYRARMGGRQRVLLPLHNNLPSRLAEAVRQGKLG